jgi:hypothetical protein
MGQPENPASDMSMVATQGYEVGRLWRSTAKVDVVVETGCSVLYRSKLDENRYVGGSGKSTLPG